MKKPVRNEKAVLELAAELRDGPHHGRSQDMVLAALGAKTFKSVAEDVSAGVDALSSKKIMALYNFLGGPIVKVTGGIGKAAKRVWIGSVREVEAIEALTTWGRAKNWILVGIASTFFAAYFLKCAALLNALSLTPKPTVADVVWTLACCSVFYVCARWNLREAKALWPIA